MLVGGCDHPQEDATQTPDRTNDFPSRGSIGGDSFKQSYDLLRPGCRLVAFGAASAFNGGAGAFDVRGPDPANLIVDSKSFIGLDLRLLWDDRGTVSRWLPQLVPLLAVGVIKPIASEVHTFAEAHRSLTTRRDIGKVVLVP